MPTKAIVCDTNVWFGLPDQVPNRQLYHLVGTLINFIELTQADMLPAKVEIVRKACAQLLGRAPYVLLNPPMVHIARVSGIPTDFDSDANAHDYREFVFGLATGDDLNPERLDDFRRELAKARGKRDIASSGLNDVLKYVREFPINKRNPERRKDYDSTRRYIAAMVSQALGRTIVIDAINWSEIELFFTVTHSHFLSLEVSQQKFKPNDVNDMFNLAYVGKDDLYWTHERRWLQIIQEARMDKYLYHG